MPPWYVIGAVGVIFVAVIAWHGGRLLGIRQSWGPRRAGVSDWPGGPVFEGGITLFQIMGYLGHCGEVALILRVVIAILRDWAL